MRGEANHIYNGMMSGCIQMSAAAGNAWLDLVEHFCRDNGECVSPEQCVAARSDFESLFELIDLAIAYW